MALRKKTEPREVAAPSEMRFRLVRYSVRTSVDMASRVRCSSGGRLGMEASNTASVEVIATLCDTMALKVDWTSGEFTSSWLYAANYSWGHTSVFLMELNSRTAAG